MFLCVKFIFVIHKKVKIFAYIRKLRPSAYRNGTGVQIIYLSPFHRQKYWGMRGNDELTSRCDGRSLDVFGKLYLIFHRQTVFGLVEKIQRVLINFFPKNISSTSLRWKTARCLSACAFLCISTEFFSARVSPTFRASARNRQVP